VTPAVFKAVRTATADELGAEVADRIGAGTAAGSIWDGLFLGCR